jgi:hypothetical protein
MKREARCDKCDVPLQSLPVTDLGFTMAADGQDVPVCRDCVKDLILEAIEHGGFKNGQGMLSDAHFSSVVLEAYSEVVPT